MKTRFLSALTLAVFLLPAPAAQAQSPLYNRKETPASQREDAKRATEAEQQKARQQKLQDERRQREEAQRQEKLKEQAAKEEAQRLQQAQQAAAQQRAALYTAPAGAAGDENMPVDNHNLQYPKTAQRLNFDVNAMNAPCTAEDVKKLARLEEKIAILKSENQRGMGEREFQSGFKQALDFFNDPAFLSEYTVLTARCTYDTKPPAAAKSTGARR